MYVMNEEERAERARVKALHKAVRSDFQYGMRVRNLAWAFVRGMKYKRVERKTRLQFVPAFASLLQKTEWGRTYLVEIDGQKYYNHNPPPAVEMARLLAKYLPEFAGDIDKCAVREGSPIDIWLKDPEGAIAEPVRVKKPYVPAAE